MSVKSDLRTNEGEMAGDVFRVGVKTPPFWPEDPDLWFRQLELQFTLSNITSDSTKFFYALSQLDHTHMSQVKDILQDPPATGKFDKLRTELTKRLTASREKQLKQLFLHEDMGDRKPSQFLRHMRNLAGPSVTDEVLLSLWSGRLPHSLQTIIASHPRLSLDELAELADRVHEIAPSPPYQVASSSAHPQSSSFAQPQPSPIAQSQSSSSSSSNEQLSREILQLTKEVAKLTSYFMHKQGRTRSRSASRNGGGRSRSRSRTRQPPADHPHCWYHYNFGARAKNCSQPCEFKSGNATGSRK